MDRKNLDESYQPYHAGGRKSLLRRLRYVARAECFGSLIYDRERDDYIPFDRDATTIFRLAQTKPFEKIFNAVSDSVDRKALRTFYELCSSIELLDEFGKFAGAFVADAAIPNLLSAPTRVHLAVTNACNFHCRHCFAASGSPYADELTTPQVKHLLDEMASLGCFGLSLGGGEPLTRRDLPQIIHHANDLGINVTVSTNAAAATSEVVETLQGTQYRRI